MTVEEALQRLVDTTNTIVETQHRQNDLLRSLLARVEALEMVAYGELADRETISQ